MRAVPAWAAPAVAAAAAGLVGLLRVSPGIDGDRQIFMTVAAAIARGQKLYVEVYDNKDPLFFWTDAVAYGLLGPVGLFILEFLLLAAVGALSCAIGVRLGARPLAGIALGVMAAGVMTVPSWFESGSSQFLGITLFFGALLAVLHGRFLVGGLIAGLMVDARLNFIVLVGVLIAVAACMAPSAWAPRVGKLVTGVAVSVLAMLVVLAARGELVGYVNAVRGNVGYTGRAYDLIYGEPGPPFGPLARALGDLGDRVAGWVVIIVVLAALSRLGFTVARRGWAAALTGRSGIGGLLVMASVAATLVLFATSHIWALHLPVVVVTTVLCVAYLLAEWTALAPPRRQAAAAALALAMLLAADATSLVRSVADARNIPTRWSLPEGDLQPALRRALPAGEGTADVALLGYHTQGFPGSMPDRVRLACKYPFAYAWYPREMLDEYQRCLAGTPDVVALHRWRYPQLGAFYAAVDRALAERFTPVEQTQSGWTIWVPNATPR